MNNLMQLLSTLGFIFISFFFSRTAVGENLPRFYWEKQGKEANIVFKDENKNTTVVASGFDSKFKSPSPLKSGFLWDLLTDYTWARRNDGSLHPVELIKVYRREEAKIEKFFSGKDGFDEVKYLFDNRGEDSGNTPGRGRGLYYEVTRDGKKGIVGFWEGKPYLALPPEYDEIECAGIVYGYQLTNYTPSKPKIFDWGWYVCKDNKKGFYTYNGNVLIPLSDFDCRPESLYIPGVNIDAKQQDRIGTKFIVYNLANNSKNNIQMTKIFLASVGINNSPHLMNLDLYNSHLYQGYPKIFFVRKKGGDEDGHIVVHQAGVNPKAVEVPELTYITSYNIDNNPFQPGGFNSVRIDRAPDCNYMAFDKTGKPDWESNPHEKVGFVIFGNDMEYIAPVFDADWTDRRAFPSVLRTFPSDSAKVFYVNADKSDEPGIIHKLYSATAGQLILDSSNMGVRKAGADNQGFLTVVDGDRECPGFISHNQDSLVVLDTLPDILRLATVNQTRYGNRFISYKGGEGIIDTITNTYLAPVFDRILPVVSKMDPDVKSGEWYITEKNGRYGLSFNATSIMPPVYDKLTQNPDSTLTFMLTAWPKKIRPSNHYHRHLTDVFIQDDTTYYDFRQAFYTDGTPSITLDYRKGFDGFTGLQTVILSADNRGELATAEARVVDFIEYTRNYQLMAQLEVAFPLAIEEYVTAHTNNGTAGMDDLKSLELAIESYNDLGLEDAVARCEQLFPLTQKVVTENIQREREEAKQRQLQAQALVQQQEAQKWAYLQNAMAQLSEIITSNIRQYQSKKTANRTRRTASTQQRRSSLPAGASFSTSSANSNTKSVTNSNPKRNPWLGSWYNSYRNYVSRIIQMQSNPQKLNLKELKQIQDDMRSTRAYINDHGGVQSKSSLEDWRP